jgi:hypothetical protein
LQAFACPKYNVKKLKKWKMLSWLQVGYFGCHDANVLYGRKVKRYWIQCTSHWMLLCECVLMVRFLISLFRSTKVQVFVFVTWNHFDWPTDFFLKLWIFLQLMFTNLHQCCAYKGFSTYTTCKYKNKYTYMVLCDHVK